MFGAGKKRTYSVVEVAAPGDRLSAAFDYLLVGLIAANVLAVILGTVHSVAEAWGSALEVFERFSVIVFSLEYIARVWSITENPRYGKPLSGRFRFVLSPMALIDLLAILPFYLPALVSIDLRFLRVLRLFRIFRIFKLARYSESMRLLVGVLKAKRAELGITFFAGGVLLVLAASLMYFAEAEAQPEKFSSIPAAMWWAIVTLTTVGYGDMSPVTGLGKLLGAGIAVLGIGMFALPAGIIGSGFVEAFRGEKSIEVCPHCGKKVHFE